MRKIKIIFLIIFFSTIIINFPLTVKAANYNYNNFTNKFFKVHVPNNWKKKNNSGYVKVYSKKGKKVYSRIKQVNLSNKRQKYLKNQKTKKFAKIYKKKIKKQFKKLSPKFVKASKAKISNYKAIRLKFTLKKGWLNAYYITNNDFTHRLITVCKRNNCSKQNKKFKKIKKSFRFVPDETAPEFAGATTAESTSTSSITVSWEAAEDEIDEAADIVYLIYQANQLEEQDYTTPTYTTEAGATSYQVNDLAEGTSYYFVVRAQDQAANSDDNTTEVIATTSITSNNEPTTTDSAESVTYLSNGSLVQASMYRPAGDGPFPAIIYNHGGTSAADPSAYASKAIQLSEGGTYVVLITAYRGDIGSEGELSLSIGDVNDVLAAIEYVKSKTYVDADKIGMVGESRGGNTTLSAASRNNTDLKAVVSWYGYVNIVTYCEYIGEELCLELYGISPLSTNYDHLIRIASPINYTSKLTMPLQNSHGTADLVVPYSQSQELTTAMGDATNYTFYSYEGAGHGSGADWTTTAITRRSDFFAEYLK